MISGGGDPARGPGADARGREAELPAPAPDVEEGGCGRGVEVPQDGEEEREVHLACQGDPVAWHRCGVSAALFLFLARAPALFLFLFLARALSPSFAFFLSMSA